MLELSADSESVATNAAALGAGDGDTLMQETLRLDDDDNGDAQDLGMSDLDEDNTLANDGDEDEDTQTPKKTLLDEFSSAADGDTLENRCNSTPSLLDSLNRDENEPRSQPVSDDRDASLWAPKTSSIYPPAAAASPDGQLPSPLPFSGGDQGTHEKADPSAEEEQQKLRREKYAEAERIGQALRKACEDDKDLKQRLEWGLRGIIIPKCHIHNPMVCLIIVSQFRCGPNLLRTIHICVNFNF